MIFALFAILLAATPGDAPSPTPDEQFRALRDAHQAAFEDFVKANEEAMTPEDRARVDAHPGRRPRDYAGGFLELARKYPGTTAAEDALIWVCSNTFSTRDSEEALRRLTRDHSRSPKLAPALAEQGHYQSIFGESNAFFRAVVANNPHREIQGLARYWLARNLADQAKSSRRQREYAARGQAVEGNPDYAKVYGADWLDRMRRLDPDALDREADALLDQVARDYADVPHNDKRRNPGPLGEVARSDLHDRRDLAVGRPAPDFAGVDLDGKPWRLADGRGKVLVLDFGSHFYCGACRYTYPRMRDLTRRLAGRRFELISINAEPEKTVEELRDAWKAEGNTWRCLFDGNWEGPIQKAWNVQSFPTIYVLDARGVIRHKNLQGEELDEAVDRLMAEAEASPAD